MILNLRAAIKHSGSLPCPELGTGEGWGGGGFSAAARSHGLRPPRPRLPPSLVQDKGRSKCGVSLACIMISGP